MIPSPDRRRVVHFNAAYHPMVEGAARQIVQAFPFETAPRSLIRDRDQILGQEAIEAIKIQGREELAAAPRSPWQNGNCERMVRTIKREGPNHMILPGANHTLRIFKRHFACYQKARPGQTAFVWSNPRPHPPEDPAENVKASAGRPEAELSPGRQGTGILWPPRL